MIRSHTLARSVRRLSKKTTTCSWRSLPHVSRLIFSNGNYATTTARSTGWLYQDARPIHGKAHEKEAFQPWDSMGAEAEFERKKKWAEDLMLSSKPSPHLLVDTIFFFVSHKVSVYTAKKNSPGVPGECLKRIVDFMDIQPREQWKGEWDDPHSVESLVQAMEFFLRPLKGTAYALRTAGTRSHRSKKMREDEVLDALHTASVVRSLIHRFVQNPLQHPKLDIADLGLWKARCWYFGNFGRYQLSPEIIKDTFGGAQGTEDCLRAMFEILHSMDENSAYDPQTREAAYATVVAAVAATDSKGAAGRAREVLRNFEGRQRARHNIIYSSVMLAYANEAKVDPEVVHGARDLWDHICGLEHLKPNKHAFNSLLLAFSNSELAEEAERLLLAQENNSGKLGLRPTNIDYNVVINAWAKNPSPDAPKRALALFHSMVGLADGVHRPEVAPDTITYTVLIDALARNPDTGKEGLDLAENLLNHCESGNDPNVQADPSMYRTYMKALSVRMARQSKSFAKTEIANRVESLMFRMKDKSLKVPKSMASDWHNASIYGSAIEAWARTRAGQAPKRALKLYSMLKEEDKRAGGVDSLRPDIKVYSDLFNCMAVKTNPRHGHPDVGLAHHVVSVANGLLNDMRSLGYPLTGMMFGMYLRVLATRGLREALEEAENILESLEEAYSNGTAELVPNCFSYQVVMEGYAKLPGGAERAEYLLNRMIALSDQYPERKTVLFPTEACFCVAMDGWSKSDQMDAVPNVERILAKAEELGVPLTGWMYTTLINSFAHSDAVTDGPERAEAVLAQMKSDYESGKNPHCKPSEESFAAFLKCWEMSGREDAAEQIEAILMHLHELQEHKEYDGVTLSYSSFRSALRAWQKIADCRPDAGDHALKLIQLVDDLYEDGKMERHYAIHLCNIALLTIAQSLDGEKASKAYDLLDRMRGLSLRSKDCAAVLNACKTTGTLEGATEEQKQEAFRIANITFLEYQESGWQPDENVYKEMLGLHGTLLDGEDSQAKRDELVGNIFSNAPGIIQQSEGIRAVLRPLLSVSRYDELTGGVTTVSRYHELTGRVTT